MECNNCEEPFENDGPECICVDRWKSNCPHCNCSECMDKAIELAYKAGNSTREIQEMEKKHKKRS